MCQQNLKAICNVAAWKMGFNIDTATYKQSGGVIKVIASIEDPVVIEKLLSHLNEKSQ